jgi:uncharacterized protein YbjT (DUF2867 family)
MILVTGVTGNVGAELAGQLAGTGVRVRGLVRRPDRVLPAGVEPVVGDLNDGAGVAQALQGASGVFTLAGYGSLPALLDAARTAGVRRVVLLSSASAEHGPRTNAVARYHMESEDAVRESGLPYTFLRPNSFMTNTLRWLPQLRKGDTVTAPWPDVPVAMIDPADIAAVAAHDLTAEDGNHIHRLTGPEPLTPGQQLAIVSDVLGRPLTFQPQSDDDARAEMSADMPQPYVDAFFEFFRDGALDESTVLPTVQQVLGRPPATLAEWTARHRDDFRTS